MHGELAQIVALVSHGNPWLARRPGYTLSLGANSTFASARSVAFEHGPDDAHDGQRPGESAAAWLVGLRERACGRLSVLTSDPFDAVSAAPVRAPTGTPVMGLESYRRWFLSGVIDGDVVVWKASWRVVSPRPSGGGLWHVRYEVADAEITPAAQRTIDEAGVALEHALADMRRFAAAPQMASWAARFDAALRARDDPDPQIFGYPDLLPPGHHALAVRRLMAMCSLGWVFAQAGWWIDVSLYSDVTQAEACTRVLHSAVLDAAQAATNSA